MRILFTTLIFTFCLGQRSLSQSMTIMPFLDSYHSALQSYNESLFAESYDAFLTLEKHVIDPNSLLSVNISFYKCKSAMKLFHEDGPKMMLNFLEMYPNNVHFNEANKSIADYFFQKREYKKAAQYYDFVDEYILLGKQRASFIFQYAYSLFSLGELQKASFLFQEILLRYSEHQKSSKYYLACIAYQNRNFATAEKYFLELINLGLYLQDAPMFVANIYHQQHSFQQVISFGLNYIDSLILPSPELYKLIAEAYYREQNYEKAIYFFKDKYLSLEAKLDPPGFYLLGQSYYRLKEYSLASSAFNKIIQVEDSLAQNAYYYLGDCYLNLEDKRSAQNAFESASNYGFNSRITEHASFNFAKLCYELGYPFADPTMILQDFINDFPNSEYFIDSIKNNLKVGNEGLQSGYYGYQLYSTSSWDIIPKSIGYFETLEYKYFVWGLESITVSKEACDINPGGLHLFISKYNDFKQKNIFYLGRDDSIEELIFDLNKSSVSIKKIQTSLNEYE